MKHIVFVERNPHIRRLLEREFLVDGYHVWGAANEQDLQELVDNLADVSLLIIDPEIIAQPDSALWSDIRLHHPKIPVVVHSFFKDHLREHPLGEIRGRVEKNWNSIGELKKMAGTILHIKKNTYG